MRHVRMRALLRSCIALTTAAVGLASTQALADAAFADGFKRSSLQLHERTSELSHPLILRGLRQWGGERSVL
jgi:hypothetical protein